MPDTRDTCQFDAPTPTDRTLPGPSAVTVGIATVGRPDVLGETLLRLRRQTRAPQSIVVCAPAAADVDGLASAFPDVVILIGPRGLPHQRNAILQHVGQRCATAEAVLFLDDDFFPDANYIAEIETIFETHPEVVMITGTVLSDGILGPGLDFKAADAALAETRSVTAHALETVFNGYGCNMSIRLAPVYENDLAFDENLPLYGWLEDVDFSRALARFGTIVKSSRAQGVHLGVKSGRQAGVRTGYSQIANPVYLIQKGYMSNRHAAFLMGRNILANIVRSLRPEPWVDRRGRLDGNLRALIDLIKKRIHPTRILTL